MKSATGGSLPRRLAVSAALYRIVRKNIVIALPTSSLNRRAGNPREELDFDATATWAGE